MIIGCIVGGFILPGHYKESKLLILKANNQGINGFKSFPRD